jgi:hypothetical protein
MFTKVSLVLILALLVAILVNQRSQGVVRAQAQIQYKVVDTGILVTPDGKEARYPGAIGAKALTSQDALDEYGKAGWQLVTQSYILGTGNPGNEHLIFMRK